MSPLHNKAAVILKTCSGPRCKRLVTSVFCCEFCMKRSDRGLRGMVPGDFTRHGHEMHSPTCDQRHESRMAAGVRRS